MRFAGSSIGCDITCIDRFKDGHSIAKRILSQTEYEMYQEYTGKRKEEFLAGRFAAREAIVKALPIELHTREIVIPKEYWKEALVYQGYEIQLSISHDGNMAMAVAVVNKRG